MILLKNIVFSIISFLSTDRKGSGQNFSHKNSASLNFTKPLLTAPSFFDMLKTEDQRKRRNSYV